MIFLDRENARPIYEQLCGQIREKILSGEWEAQRKLPSGREMARELNVSRNTVDQAYQQLFAEGYLFSRPRCGYFVEVMPVARPTLRNEKTPAVMEIKSPAAEKWKVDFRYGKLAEKDVPFRLWKKIMLRSYSEENDGALTYGESQGLVGLRREIVHYLREYRDVQCQPEQVVIGPGTLHCLGLLSNLLRKRGCRVAFEDPGYGKSRAVFENHGLSVCPVSVEKDGLDLRELAKCDANAVYVTPSHQFPTGAILPIGKRLQLLQWAEDNRAVIIEDDYACHFRYDVKPIPALQGLSRNAEVVYMGNFAKPLLPSLRLSFMVLPPFLLEEYHCFYGCYNSSVPYLYQRALELFMQEGHWQRHLRRMQPVYKRKRDCLLAALQEVFADRVEVLGHYSGLFMMLQVHGSLREEQLIAAAAARGVRVYPVRDHWQRQENYEGNRVLLGYSSLRPEEIRLGVELLAEAWRNIEP